MNTYLVVTVLLIVLTLLIVLIGNEQTGAKIYRALGAAAMATIGVVAFKMVATNTQPAV